MIFVSGVVCWLLALRADAITSGNKLAIHLAQAGTFLVVTSLLVLAWRYMP